MKIGDLVRIKNIGSCADARNLSLYGYNETMVIYSGKIFIIDAEYSQWGPERIFRLNSESMPGILQWSWTEK